MRKWLARYCPFHIDQINTPFNADVRHTDYFRPLVLKRELYFLSSVIGFDCSKIILLLRIFWFQGHAIEEGAEECDMDGIRVRIYSSEKTLADCFKYRNKIGLDVALEALKLYRQCKRFKADALMHFTRICRVEKVMRPHLRRNL
jgi:hypothetical protein